MKTAPLKKFRARIAAVLLLAVSPFVALVLLQGMENRRHAAQQARTESRRLVRLITVVHRQLLGDARQLLFVLGNVPAVQRGEADACARMFHELVAQYPQYSNLWLAHSDGRIIATAHPVDLPVDREDLALLDAPATVGAFVEGPLRVTPRQRPVMSVVHRVDETRVVLLALELQWLTREAATVDLPDGSSVTVWDEAGSILLRHPEPERWIGRRSPDSEVFQAILASAGDGTAQARGVDRIERLYGFGRLAGRSEAGALFLAVGVPSGHAFAAASRSQRRNLIVLAVAALGAAVASWMAGDRLVFPIVKRLQDLAHTDPLTSLANRRSFLAAAERELQRARRYGRPLALLMLDIDRFKAVNDRHGHVAGDAVLREVARRMRTAVRDGDLVARYGGEEFVVLLPESDAQSARAAAEGLREAVAAAPVVAAGKPITVTISAGVASLPQPDGGLAPWLDAADEALYRAKANGRNRVESAESGAP